MDSACTNMTLNGLSITCNGSLIPKTNLTGDIVAFERLAQLPAPEQVKLGVDMNNFLAASSGKLDLKAHEYATLTATKLVENTTYVIFTALHATKDGMDIFSLKEEAAQIVVKTLGKIS